MISANQEPPGREPQFSKERDRRVQAEDSLRHSEEIFRHLVEGVTDYAIFMLDRSGRVATWNLGAERLKGYRADEVIGQHFSVFYPQAQIDRGWPAHELKVAAAEGRFEDEGWRVRKDGSLFWANVIITAMYEGGELRGYSKVTRDLTDRKQAEEELRHGRDLLEQKVQERTAELMLANARLQEHSQRIGELVRQLETADRRKNEFLATLAHELRNPLAPIRHALQILCLVPDQPEIQEQARGVIERQLAQMVRLIDDLLDVSRITQNKLQLRKERIELAAAIQSAIETTRPLIESAGHELSVQLPAQPVYLDADLTRLAQVFTNLLNNSVKYTDAGGSIRVAAEVRDGNVVVSVRDNGIGITPEHLPHLFEMFSQAAPALERSGGGLGIGLALARGVVVLHGGTIEARSDGPGQGSELIVCLPLAEPPGGRQPQHSGGASESRQESRRRVLVADDNQDSAESLSLLLELSGHEVWAVHDGLRALEAAAAHRPDAALLDIGMPAINGYEAARRIREQPWGKDMLLVAITGWGQDEDKQQAREAGFDHHLTKPINLDELKSLLALGRDPRGPSSSDPGQM